jgi:prophage DNA circulation protein
VSDYTITLQNQSDSPAFLSRLRTGRYTSPNGTESVFLFDELTRTRGKKSSSHEIADSNTTILQDLGSSLHVFSLEVFFVGANCDLEADKFYESLFERYTPDTPGVLNHPRWGDRNVIPFGDPSQTERYTSEAGVSRISVEFRETVSAKAFKTSALSSADVSESAKQAKETALSRAVDIAQSGAKAYNKFRAVVKSKVAIIKRAIDNVTGLTDDIRAEVDAIHQGILDALTLAATPAVILGQVDAMIETVASIPQDTANLATAIFDMTTDVIDSFGVDLASAKTSEDVQNIGATYQSIATSCVAYSGVSSLAIDYNTRDQVGASIDSLVDLHDQYTAQTAAFASVSASKVSGVFIPDTDIERIIHGIVFDSSAILLSRAFSLKSRRLYTLSHPSDPMTETWTHYGTMDDLEFFCATNKIIGNEFIELPAGRTLVFYE